MIESRFIDGYWCAYDVREEKVLFKHKNKEVVMEQMLFNFFSEKETTVIIDNNK